jgi:hypothetical protein
MMTKLNHNLFTIGILTSLIGWTSAQCAESEPAVLATPTEQNAPPPVPDNVFTVDGETLTLHPETNARRNAYFGDIHVHTMYSFDAFLFGTMATPDDAYRYAKGAAIKHPGEVDVQLREPLDFYAVTDHAMFLGMVASAADPTSELSKLDLYKSFHNLNAPENMGTDSIDSRLQGFYTVMSETPKGLADGSIDKDMATDIARSAWLDTIRAAERHNDPGKFTTFIAYEYTGAAANYGPLHRNIIFKGNDRAPSTPFSRYHSQDPEGLWDWMDDLRKQGIESLAIPHNSNMSVGQMFTTTDWFGNPIDDAYADQRMRNEPLVEITQIKGTSETHPALSPNDEWADFEILSWMSAPGNPLAGAPEANYIRGALRQGLAREEAGGVNPYKLGFIGSSDTHTGATPDEESNYPAKNGILDLTSAQRGSIPLPVDEATAPQDAGNGTQQSEVKYADGYITWGASGLAGVWAEENTREAIYNAFRRKETFATSGPRIRVRFFAGYNFDSNMLDSKDMVAKAYAEGVTMGSDLLARQGSIPQFLVWALRDARGAALQRIQVVKGAMIAGKYSEAVYDVACSEGQKVDPKTHRCPDSSATVNLADCSTADVGASELKSLWADPDFDAAQRAYYYVRVLENPTCRWSTWDALRAGVKPRSDVQPTLQERAWSSPIWYVP